MLYEKHKPIFLDDYKIHLNIIPKLQKLCKTNICNLLIYGSKGSGKLTLVKSMINTYFNKNIIEKDNIIKLNAKDVFFKSSNYYFEIILNNYYNKKNFELLLLHLCENNDINSDFKLIIIKNIEYVNIDAFRILKYMIEKKYNKIRFILITSKISSINSFLKGYFLLLRVPQPDKTELFNYITTIYTISPTKIKSIINNSNNLTDLFMILEINTLNNYICPYKSYSNKFIKLIENKKSINILKIRELLYTIMSKNYDLKLICHSILNYLLTSNIENKHEIIELYTKYDKTYSFKNIIHIECLLINLMNIIK